MRNALIVVLGVLAALCTGCGTTINVVANPNSNVGEVHTAHLVIHNSPPNDMDNKVQLALAAQNLTVTTSTSDSGASADLLVKFDDHWNWDMAMYLHSLEMQFFDGRSGTLLATSRWSDGAMHGFRDSAKAAADLVAATFKKLGIPTAK